MQGTCHAARRAYIDSLEVASFGFVKYALKQSIVDRMVMNDDLNVYVRCDSKSLGEFIAIRLAAINDC